MHAKSLEGCLAHALLVARTAMSAQMALCNPDGSTILEDDHALSGEHYQRPAKVLENTTNGPRALEYGTRVARLHCIFVDPGT